MMKKRNIRRWHMHPMVRVALETIIAFIALIIIGVALATFVVYLMLWLC